MGSAEEQESSHRFYVLSSFCPIKMFLEIFGLLCYYIKNDL